METGRKRKGRKNLGGAGLREMDTREGCVGKNGREVRWLPPKVPFLTFFRFYGIPTVFSRESRKERLHDEPSGMAYL